MIRLVAFILVFAVFLAFIVFNLDNKCDVSLGFSTFKEIPVFLSSFFSFVLGMLFTLPMVFSSGRKRRNSSQAGPSDPGSADPSGPENKRGWGPWKKRHAVRERKSDDADLVRDGSSVDPNETKRGSGPYGID